MSKISRKEFKEFLTGKKLFVENQLKEVKDVLAIINDGGVMISGNETYWLHFTEDCPTFVSAETFYKDLADVPEIDLKEFLEIEESDFCDWSIGDVLVCNKKPFIFGGWNGKYIISLGGINDTDQLVPFYSSCWALTAKKADAIAKTHLYKILRDEGYTYDDQRQQVVETHPRVMPGRKFFFIAPDFSKKEYRVFYTTEDGLSEGLCYLFHKQRNYFYSKQDALDAIAELKF